MPMPVPQQNQLQNDDNELVHDNKKKDEGRSIKDDAMSLAMLSLYTGKKVREIMSEDRYWTYVMQHDEHYSDRVVEEAVSVKKEFKANPKRFLPLVPPKKDQGQGEAGGGGMPPPMGGSKARVVTADGGLIYLYRSEDGASYRLKNTVAGRIFAGRYPIYFEDGSVNILSLNTTVDSYSTTAPKNGNVDKMLDALEREFPKAMMSSLVKGLTEAKINGAEDVASAMMGKMWAAIGPNKGIASPLNLYDILPNLMRPSHAMLVEMANMPEQEPPEIEHIRKTVGGGLASLVHDLRTALSLDNVGHAFVRLYDGIKNPRDLEEKRKRTEEQKQNGRDSLLGKIPRSPSVLMGTIRGNMDIKSITMTAMATDTPEQMDQCMKAIVGLMRVDSWAYERRPLSNDEASRIAARARTLQSQQGTEADEDLAKNGNALVIAVRAWNGNDAEFMSCISFAKTKGSEDLVFGLGQIAVSQKRLDIVKSMPGLALGKHKVNDDIIRELDLTDVESMRVLMDAWKVKRHADSLSGPVVEKMAGLALGGNETAMLRLASSDPAVNSQYSLLSYACAFDNKYLSYGESDPLSDTVMNIRLADVALADQSRWIFDTNLSKLLALSILENKPASSVLGSTKTAPKDLMSMKPDMADKMIKTRRVDFDGNKIPAANEIHSLPENPLRFAKSLMTLGDAAGLLTVLNLISEKFVLGPNPEVEYALEYTMQALKQLGHENEAQSVLTMNRLRMDGQGLRRVMTPSVVPHSDVATQHVVDCFESGDLVSAARFSNILFKRNPHAVMEALNGLQGNGTFADMLDPAVRNSPQAPGWAKPTKDVEATMLPNGFVVVGRNGMYEVAGYCYACSRADSLSIGMEKTQG